MCVLSHVRLPATLGTVALQASLVHGIFRQEHWSGSSPTPGDLPDPGIKPTCLASPALASRFFTTSVMWGNTKIKVK